LIFFADAIRTTDKEAKHTIHPTTYGSTTPSRSGRGTYYIRSTGQFPDWTDQQLSDEEIISSVRSINEHAQHSYSHVIRIYRCSCRQAGRRRYDHPEVSARKIPDEAVKNIPSTAGVLEAHPF
jgi:hypothetical protein